MKILGYKREGSDAEELLEMAEISISVDPETFRAIALFFNTAADEIEKHGIGYEHEHLRDAWPKCKENYPDLQAYNNLLESES